MKLFVFENLRRSKKKKRNKINTKQDNIVERCASLGVQQTYTFFLTIQENVFSRLYSHDRRQLHMGDSLSKKNLLQFFQYLMTGILVIFSPAQTKATTSNFSHY